MSTLQGKCINHATVNVALDSRHGPPADGRDPQRSRGKRAPAIGNPPSYTHTTAAALSPEGLRASRFRFSSWRNRSGYLDRVVDAGFGRR